MLNQLRILCLILLLPLFPAALTGFIFPLAEARASLQREGELTLQEAIALQPLWVDARSEAEYTAGHIPQALLLNEDAWDSGFFALLENWDLQQPIVVYCSSRTCDASHAIAERLKTDLDFEQVYVLQGGWEAWQNR